MNTNWDTIFAEAHLHSWPTASLLIQSVNPSPHQGGRNIYKEDREMIHQAAQRHGYRIVGDATRAVCFIRVHPCPSVVKTCNL